MKKEVKIDYLYLDLETCDRCIGTDEVLEEVIKEITPTFSLAGYNIVYNKIKIENEAEAAKYYFSNLVDDGLVEAIGAEDDTCDALAFFSALKVCYELIRKDIVEKMKEEMK